MHLYVDLKKLHHLLGLFQLSCFKPCWPTAKTHLSDFLFFFLLIALASEFIGIVPSVTLNIAQSLTASFELLVLYHCHSYCGYALKKRSQNVMKLNSGRMHFGLYDSIDIFLYKYIDRLRK